MPFKGHKEYLAIKQQKWATHFSTKYMLPKFLTLMVWLGDKFSWTALGVAILVAAAVPAPARLMPLKRPT